MRPELRIPGLAATTDLITGFPGETAADFEEGLAFVDTLRFADAHIFPFSARAGTAAATFDGQVDRARRRRAHSASTKWSPRASAWNAGVFWGPSALCSGKAGVNR